MTKEEKALVAKKWNLTCKLYMASPDLDLIYMMVDDLKNYPVDLVLNALEVYRLNKANKHFPKSCDIIEILEPRESTNSIAVQSAGLVLKAVRAFGYTNPRGAREMVGEAAWDAVNKYGGWDYICQNLGTTINVATFQAQIREVCKSTLEKNQNALQDYTAKIEAANSSHKLTKIIKQLEEVKTI